MPNPQYLGLIYGLSAYIIWGTFPLFFHLLKGIEPLQVLTQRVIWSFLFVAIIMLVMRRWPAARATFRSRTVLASLLLSSLMIATNWLLFIWGVSEGRVLECSLGYFLTPLVSVLLARVFLQEQLDRFRLAACLLAVIGVLWQVVSLGTLPWLSLALAASFGLYGLVRKQMPVDSLTGLSVETGLLLPLALAYWLYLESQGSSQFMAGHLQTDLLLMASGVVTALPLLLFAAGTKKLTLSAIGFMMYINPTMQFFTAVYLFKEPFSSQQLIGFIFIWAALTVFSIGALRQEGKRRAQAKLLAQQLATHGG